MLINIIITANDNAVLTLSISTNCKILYITMILRLCGFGMVIFCLITIYHPERHAKHYYYIPLNDITTELVKYEDGSSPRTEFCSYTHLFFNNNVTKVKDIFIEHQFETPKTGGEFIPTKCKPLYKTAIIISYRKREEQLKIFLNYMHNFLQKQDIHYRIYVVDQTDSMPFNRAMMFNIGAVEAMNDGFPCLILHDVDLIPLSSGNIYTCTKRPRHMSSCLDSFRYNLPYVELSGGVIAITAKQFNKINGMSNLYIGWGGEDDDLYRRLKAYNITPYRFPPDLSKYTMLKHKKAIPSEHRYEMLKDVLNRQNVDGLNSLKSQYVVENKELYTHVVVR